MSRSDVGLNDHERAGYARPRERYEDWCQQRDDGWQAMRETERVEAAEAKRTRKAAKRQRDAERTAAGQERARCGWVGEWRRCSSWKARER